MATGKHLALSVADVRSGRASVDARGRLTIAKKRGGRRHVTDGRVMLVAFGDHFAEMKFALKTVNVANLREHHFARSSRVAKERKQTRAALVAAFGPPPSLPLRISITRFSPSEKIDSDGAIIAMKNARDEIATWLGVDDHDTPDLVWDYSEPKAIGPMAVRVRIDWSGI